MIGSVIFQEAMRRLMRHELPDVTRRDLVAGLEAGRKVLPVIYSAAIEAALPREEQHARALAIYFAHCTGNVADDVADGDCDYFERDVPVATTVQYLLHALFHEAVLMTSIDRETLRAASTDLVQAAAWQPVELRTKIYDEQTYLDVARAIGGRQWRAYLRLLWAGTSLEQAALVVADAVALSSFVALDVEGKDKRFYTLTEAARTRVTTLARDALVPAAAHRLSFVELTAKGVEMALAKGAA